MAGIVEQPVASWDDLAKVANAVPLGNRLAVDTLPYVFRGHESAEFTLQSTLHRAVTRDGASPLPDPQTLVDVEGQVTASFKAIAPTHLSPAALEATHANLDWWCLMRHYGVPTRVIDWTCSMYIAAYFACSRRPSADGTIYMLQVRALNDAVRAANGPATDIQGHPDQAYAQVDAAPVISVMSRMSAQIDRMVAQQGVFMACRNVAADIEGVLASTVPAEVAGWPALLKLRIAAAAKPRIMRQLGAMNVSANSLFPGVDGIGRHLEELVRYRSLQRRATVTQCCRRSPLSPA
jgi:hypothetical protein